jgi:probable HAF family extracellular repeat protein
MSATSAAGAEFGVTDLGSLGGGFTEVRGIGAHVFPYVVGRSRTASGAEHAFYGNLIGLNDIGTLGGARSEARAVAGRVVGFSELADGRTHAFARDFTSLLQDLGTLGGANSFANGINDYDVIVGGAETSSRGLRAFAHQNGVMIELAVSFGGANTAATDINNHGHIVGYSSLPDGRYHAFRLVDGTVTDLAPSSTTSEAIAINDAGVVIGVMRSPASGQAQRAFRFEGGVLDDLGTLGGGSAEAHAVNAAGTIVGSADDAAGQRRAFIWRNGSMVDLNTLLPAGTGWVLETARAISDDGLIAGNGTRNGEARAFLLTPPLDLSLDLVFHENLLSTNFPNPHEAGQPLWFGATVRLNAPFTATGVTVTETFTGPVQILDWTGGNCVQDGLRLTCRMPAVSFGFGKDLIVRVRATGAGTITHSATVSADQPDPDLSNNSGTESNVAVSLASFTALPAMVLGGQLSVGEVTLTSPTPIGGATVALSSSRPDIVEVPSNFGVVPWVNGGLSRAFWIRTQPVTTPVFVQLTASYGVDTLTADMMVMPPGSQWPFGGIARDIPGTIQAEDFDEGGEGVAYHDTSLANETAAYRATDVDLRVTTDAGGGFNVGWVSPGEWLEYGVNASGSGEYLMEVRVASPDGGGTFHVEVDGVDLTGAISMPPTGGWNSWASVERSIFLTAGAHVLRLAFDTANSSGAIGDVNFLRFTTPASRPFGGIPWAVPGVVEAENFDDGGNGIAYYDSSSGNRGGQYRSTDVDIEGTADAGGGYNIGWMRTDEWLAYTISVPQSGTYELRARAAADGPGGSFHFEFGGGARTGSLTFPDTAGWQNWTDVTAQVTLSAGVQRMRLVLDSPGPTGIYGNVNHFTLSAVLPP